MVTPDPVVDGWKDISAALGVDERTARGYANRNVDPLPTRRDHRSRIYIFRAALQAWVNRNDMAYQTHAELERLRAEVKKAAG